MSESPERVRLICNPAGVDGPIYVPGLGLFAPGEVSVAEDAAAVLLSTPHFARADEVSVPAESPTSILRARATKE